MDTQHLIEEFVEYVKKMKVELYNEASVQYELAFFLRRKLKKKNYKIQLERNVSYFGLKKGKFEKAEIDITIFSADMKEKSAIEIKFPTYGENPAQMFSFCTVIKFLEELQAEGFHNNIFIVLTSDHLFWEGREEKNIYEPFRKTGVLEGIVKDPFSSYKIKFCKRYNFKWQDGFKDEDGKMIKFFIVKI